MTRDELTQAAIDYLANAFNAPRVDARTLEAAVAVLSIPNSGTTTKPSPVEPPPPPPPAALPAGYDDPNQGVAFDMFKDAMQTHGLTPLGVQGHGQQIVDAMNASWPGWNVYLSPSDAPVAPGFGSLDVTIDSGKGGWAFRPDGVTRYEPDPAKR
jgi:hypothetical protein